MITMESNKKKIILRLVADVVCIACIGFPVLILFVSVKPYQRGFYCDDESLMHPYKTNTIPTWVAGFVGIVLPSLSVTQTAIKAWMGLKFSKIQHGSTELAGQIFIILAEGVKIQQIQGSLRKYIKTCYQLLIPFYFGAGVSQLTTDIAKYSIGRLRPHFITVCQPNINSCTSNTGYIEDDVCTGNDAAAIEEARLSFPSGHTSISFYCMIWLMIYLHYRFTWKRFWLVRAVLQAIAFYLAYYTALSRISDYMHHWSDVLSGAILGTAISLLDAFFISPLRKKFPTKCSDCSNSSLPLYQRRDSTSGSIQMTDDRHLQDKHH